MRGGHRRGVEVIKGGGWWGTGMSTVQGLSRASNGVGGRCYVILGKWLKRVTEGSRGAGIEGSQVGR